MRIDYQASREEKKNKRTSKVKALVVTVYRGKTRMTFNGDEDSQRRMFMRAQRMRANNTPTIRWVLADNSEVNVTVEELEQALDLAMEQQGELWFL